MGLFDKLMGRDLPERRDARRVYFRLLEQSRDPAFFGPGRIADDFDGRIDIVALHMSVMLYHLRGEGEDGKLLSQALFDEMKDDFEVALREEGISDTGVKRRIKPMIGHFYDRLKTYTEAIEAEAPQKALADGITERTESDGVSTFELKVADYALDWRKLLESVSFKDLTRARFPFANI